MATAGTQADPTYVVNAPGAGDASAANQTALNTAVGAQADAAATTDAGTFSVLAFIKRGLANWTTLLARVPALVSGRIPVDVPALIAGTAIIGKVGGDTAAGATFPTNPFGSGGRVATTQPTARTDGQLAGQMAGTRGELITKDFSPSDLDWSYSAVPVSGTFTIRAAGAAGLRNYITGIQINGSSAGTAANLTISDGITALFQVALPAGAFSYSFILPSPPRGAAATLIQGSLSASTTAGVFVNAQGYVAP